MNKTILTCTLAALFLPSPVLADSCLPVLQPSPSGGGYFTLTTLNRNSLVSYSHVAVAFYKGFRTQTGGALPARWATGNSQPSAQLFSDRFAGQGQSQPFSANNADLISVSVSVAVSPAVTVTLNSHHNGASHFTATCSPNGVLHGVADGVDFLLRLAVQPQI